MKFIKTVRVVEEKVCISSMFKNGKYFETGTKVVLCPQCGRRINIRYFVRNKEEPTYDEKYCPYCGKKLVRQDIKNDK